MLAAMSFIEAALQETAEYSATESIEAFRESIDPRWIEEALAATGAASLRKRRLPAEQVIWLVLGMALQRDRPITEVVSKLELALPGAEGSREVSSSSAVQARKRLGAEPMEWLFNETSVKWTADHADLDRFHGLSVFGADGSTLRVADSDDNRAYFGLSSNSKGASGYPLVRVVTLLGLRSRMLVGAAFGPYARSELALSKELWPRVPDSSLTVLDKGFYAAEVLVGLQRTGQRRHWLLRARKSMKWSVLDSFGRYDKLVELQVSRDARRLDPTLPKTFVARAISYRFADSAERSWLLTSLLDAKEFPSREIVALYHERWEIELAYDEIKTHLLQREETIRSRTVEGVKQELWGVLLMYNLIRLEMVKMAAEANVPPARISFTTAMREIRREWEWLAVASPGSIPRKLGALRQMARSLVLPERRSKRRFPRVVKLQSTAYDKKLPRRSLK